ncbi:MAG: hypothetical protein DCC75_12070, partial [Proteobacteria bacterium]
MRLRFVAPLIAVLVLAVLLLHNLQQEFGRGSAAHFKVGVIVPLTGSLGDYGMAIYNSIELAKRDRPEVFDRVQFIFEDVQYDTKSAISAFHNLRQLQKIDLVYVWGVTFCKALAPLAEAVRLPMVGQCIDQEAASGRHFILRFMNYSSEYMLVQAEYLKQRGLNRIGIILADNSYLEEMYTALVENLLPGQRLEIIERIPITDMDLRTPISKAKFVEYDAVGVFLGPGQISQFYRQAREQSLSTPTFGTNFFESLSE